MNLKTTRFGLLLHVVGLVFLAATASVSVSQEIKIVAPNAYENVEGESRGEVAVSESIRYQQVFQSSEFDGIPDTHQTIVGLYLRPDRTATPRTVNYDGALLQLSTTTKIGSELDRVFDNNVGDDMVTVTEGSWDVSTQATGPPEGPKDFDYYYPFDTSFSYDPSTGRNLLFDVTFRGLSPDLWDDVYITNSAQSLFAQPAASSGIILNSGTIAQFVFVPEPSTILLGCLGCLCLLKSRRRRAS